MDYIRVALADKDVDMLSYIHRILRKAKDIEIVGETRNGISVIKAVNQFTLDILVMDIRLNDMDAQDVVRIIQNENNTVRIVILSKFLLEQTILQLLGMGVSGYVAKEEAGEWLIPTLKAVMDGVVCLSPTVREQIRGSRWDMDYSNLK